MKKFDDNSLNLCMYVLFIKHQSNTKMDFLVLVELLQYSA